MVLYILCRKEACFGGDFRQEKALDRETPRASLLLTVPMDVEVDRDVGDVRSAAAAAAAATAGPASGYFRDLAVDFVGGCVSGCAGIFVGQPFDTVKVRLQTQSMGASTVGSDGKFILSVAPGASKTIYPTASACAVGIVTKEGPLALFKGMSTPIASAALINAITFGAYAQSQRLVASYGLGGSGRNESDTKGDAAGPAREGVSSAGLVWSWLGGSFAGLCQSAIVIPTETIKVKLQVQVGALGSDALRYSGAIDCAAKVVRAEGLAGLFRGTTATVFRETPAFGLYFACYEGTKDWLERRWCWGQQASSFGAGGIAGTLSWVSIYPFDVVKSVQQASTDPMDPYSRSMITCFRSLYREAGGGVPGVSRFFRGVGTTVVRAFPVNAVIFPVYEWTVKIMNQASPSSSLVK